MEDISYKLTCRPWFFTFNWWGSQLILHFNLARKQQITFVTKNNLK
jgi:hypothetical protein